MDSSATPLGLSDSCGGTVENRCHMSTPAPLASTPFPYAPLTPYGTHPYPYMTRFPTPQHLHSTYNSSINASIAASLYPSHADLFHYNPFSALTPTSPLTPSSFWSLTAQQSYHQLSGLSFGPSSLNYNANAAHLYNLFSPNSISSLSPTTDGHSPSLYPRVSSLPSPYSSSPGLSSAFMSPSSMPLLLSPSLASSVDRPPTYLSDDRSPSTNATTTTLTTLNPIKCEPTESFCLSRNQNYSNHLNSNCIKDVTYSHEERHIEKTENNSLNLMNNTNENNNSKTKTKFEAKSKPLTNETIQHFSPLNAPQNKQQTTITKVKEKHSARVEPLMRIQETIENVVRNGSNSIAQIKCRETSDNNECDIIRIDNNIDKNKSFCDKVTDNESNTNLESLKCGVIESKVIKQELIECDNSMPSNVKPVPNINSNKIYNNDDNHIKVDNNVRSDTNLVNDSNNSILNGSNSNINENCDSINKSNKEKDAKLQQKESQLKQLQSYRHKAESHRIHQTNSNQNGSQIAAAATAISIVLPKPKDNQVTIEHHHKPNTNEKPIPNAIKNVDNTSLCTLSSSPSGPLAEQIKQQNLKMQTNIPNSEPSLPAQQKYQQNKVDNSDLSISNAQQKLIEGANNATKQLPKKPRISRKHPSSSIPVGIAIAQQRNTSPKTKSSHDSHAPNILNTQPSALKPILPTLSLPMMTANSPILITDSPPTGTSLWIKPAPTASQLSTNNSIHASNSQFSFTGDYQLARDSLTGQLYLIRNSSSLPSTPTGGKPPAIIPSLTIKTGDQQKATQSPTILMPTMGATHPSSTQQFFATAIGTTPTSTLILEASAAAPLVQIATSAPLTSVISNVPNNSNSSSINSRSVKENNSNLISNNINGNLSDDSIMLNVERGTQACISDDEAISNDNMKTTACQVDMDHIHSSEEDDDNEGKTHKLAIIRGFKKFSLSNSPVDTGEDNEDSSRDSIRLQIVDERVDMSNTINNNMDEITAPVLPVKSAPVMEFIDHHGLDLLVDSIEEFAAREESNASSPVDGLQLLSALAEQRSREERGCDKSPPRRHSADCAQTSLLFSNALIGLPVKKRQRSESMYTSPHVIYDYNENDDQTNIYDKKLMKTSSCQTDIYEKRRRHLVKSNKDFNLRRSERIFIHDSVVISKDANEDKDSSNTNIVLNNAVICNSKRKDSEIKLKIKINTEDKDKDKDKDNIDNDMISHSLTIDKSHKDDQIKTFCSKMDKITNSINNLDIVNQSFNKNKIEQNIHQNNSQINDSNTKIKPIKKKKNVKIEKNLSTSSISSIYDTILSVSLEPLSKNEKQEQIIKKRKKNQITGEASMNKKPKFDSNFNSEEVKKTDGDIKIISSKKVIVKDDSNNCDNNKDKIDMESSDGNKEIEDKSNNLSKRKSKPLVNRLCFELYDEKRMRLLDETIDEIISRPFTPSDTIEDLPQTSSLCSESSDMTVSTSPQILPQSSFTSSSPASKSRTPSPQPQPQPQPEQHSEPQTQQLTPSSTSSTLSESLVLLQLRLSASDLDIKMNVIMLVDGLLFVGEICPIQAPDIYGIILHGERQHRPHIYSQEEMLREAIREVKPTLEELREGQRVCAYWSTQYRHLYPGYVRSSSPHPNLVFVEFDDGDNGRIAIDDIRLLPQDYPQMKINADPLKNLERRRRMSSCGKESRTSKSSDNSGDTKNGSKMINSDSKTCSDALKAKKVNESLTKLSSTKELNSVNDEVKSSDLPKKNSSNSTKLCKASNTCYSIKNTESRAHSPSNSGSLSMKFGFRVRKKKKHTKDDRHHRHHHKHHHCRHHRKCKKHKKMKEDNSNNSISGNSSDGKETKSTKTSSTRNSYVSYSKKEMDAQKIKNDNKDNKESNDELKKQPKISLNLAVCNNKSGETSLKKSDEKCVLVTPTKKSVTRLSVKQRTLDNKLKQIKQKACTETQESMPQSPKRQKRNSAKYGDSKDTNLINSSSDNKISSPKKRERVPSSEKSKIAPFLPERQIWHWSGKSIRRTGNKGSRTRKIYYKEIERGREHIRVEDCAVFLSTGRPHLPYIGRIDSMWQTGNGTMIVKVRWFYHPEETKGESIPLLDKRGALFESSHFDINDVQTISHKCQVISWNDYQQKKRENSLPTFDDPPNIYYLAGQYEAMSGRVDMDPNVPLKDTKDK